MGYFNSGVVTVILITQEHVHCQGLLEVKEILLVVSEGIPKRVVPVPRPEELSRWTEFNAAVVGDFPQVRK